MDRFDPCGTDECKKRCDSYGVACDDIMADEIDRLRAELAALVNLRAEADSAWDSATYNAERARKAEAELAACREDSIKAKAQIETLENMLLHRFGGHVPGGCYVRYPDYCECGWTQERLNIAARKGEETT